MTFCSFKHARFCLALAAVMLAVLAGCTQPAPEPGEKAPVEPAAPAPVEETQAPAVATPEPESTTLGDELLANPSFDQGFEGWRVLPQQVGAVEAADAASADAASAVRLSPHPKKSYSTLEQPVELPAGSLGKTIQAQVRVKGAKGNEVGMAIEVVGVKKRRLVQADTAGSEDWETLSATAEVPQLAEGEQLLFRVFLRPAATSPVLIDDASVKLSK